MSGPQRGGRAGCSLLLTLAPRPQPATGPKAVHSGARPPCCVFQSSPALQEVSERPASPTSPLSDCQSSHVQEAPTTSQGLLKLFQRNVPMEDLGAKGVSQSVGPCHHAGPGLGDAGHSLWPCDSRHLGPLGDDGQRLGCPT